MYLSKNQDDRTFYSQLQYIALWIDLRQSIQRGRIAGQDRPTRRPDKSPVDSLVRSLDQERQAYLLIYKELVERDLDRTLSTYIKCQENPDSAERCPSEAQRSCKYADVRTQSSLNITLTPYHFITRTRRDSYSVNHCITIVERSMSLMNMQRIFYTKYERIQPLSFIPPARIRMNMQMDSQYKVMENTQWNVGTSRKEGCLHAQSQTIRPRNYTSYKPITIISSEPPHGENLARITGPQQKKQSGLHQKPKISTT